MVRGLQPPVSWIATCLLLLWLVPATGVAAPFTHYQFRPLPGEESSSRQPQAPGDLTPGSAYPGVGAAPRQPRYRFREQSGDSVPRYSMPGYRALPGRQEREPEGQARKRPSAPAQSVPGYRFRPDGDRRSSRTNR